MFIFGNKRVPRDKVIRCETPFRALVSPGFARGVFLMTRFREGIVWEGRVKEAFRFCDHCMEAVTRFGNELGRERLHGLELGGVV